MKKTLLTLGIISIFVILGGVFFVDPLLSGEGGSRREPGEVSNEHLPLSGQVITENGAVIKVRVADTPETRQRGLSGFKKMESDQGMLFVFDEPGRYSFWMKDMQFAIDIIWLKKTGLSIDGQDEYNIVHSAEQVTPESFPETFVSNDLTDAVLEINSSMASVYNLSQDRMVWITF